MKIELHEIAIRDVVKNYIDNAEDGVIGYDGKLNIRPKYQREFVYGEKERNAVIDTINKGFPLNVYKVSVFVFFPIVSGRFTPTAFAILERRTL